MQKDTLDGLRAALDKLKAFGEESDAMQHFDSGEALEVMGQAYDAIEAVFTPRLPGPKIDKVCETCGGMLTFEGWIEWSIADQDFVVRDICDKGHICGECDGYTHSVDKIVEPEPAPESKPYTVEILWGEHPQPGDEPVSYRFETQGELRSFCEGIEAGDGWMGYEVVYTDEETPTPPTPARKKFSVHVRLADEYEAASEDEAFDMMMDALDGRKGMEIQGHDILPEPFVPGAG